jgi:hypothetical protein
LTPTGREGRTGGLDRGVDGVEARLIHVGDLLARDLG